MNVIKTVRNLGSVAFGLESGISGKKSIWKKAELT
jgi:hypothetical protein